MKNILNKYHFDWWLVGFCLTRTLSGLAHMTYAGALPVLQTAWGMSAAAAGSVSSGFQFGYAVSLVACSELADRIGPRPVFLTSMLTGAIFSIGFAAFARDYTSALVLYTLAGISLGGTYTTGLMILAAKYPVQRRGMAIGFFIASTSLGYGSSLILTGITLPVGGYVLSFWVTCMGPLFGGLLAWLVLRKTQIQLIKRQRKEKVIKAMLSNRPAMLYVGGYAFHCWELLGMWAWTPAFLASCLTLSGLEGQRAAGIGANINAVFHLIGLLASFSMGMLSDRMDRAKVIFIISSISAFCSFIFGWALTWPLTLVMVIGVIYAFFSLGDSPILSAGLTETAGPSYMGAAFGLRSLLGFGIGSLSPTIFGVVLDWTNPSTAGSGQYYSWGWAYSVLGIGGAGAAWIAYCLIRRQSAERLSPNP